METNFLKKLRNVLKISFPNAMRALPFNGCRVIVDQCRFLRCLILGKVFSPDALVTIQNKNPNGYFNITELNIQGCIYQKLVIIIL